MDRMEGCNNFQSEVKEDLVYRFLLARFGQVAKPHFTEEERES